MPVERVTLEGIGSGAGNFVSTAFGLDFTTIIVAAFLGSSLASTIFGSSRAAIFLGLGSSSSSSSSPASSRLKNAFIFSLMVLINPNQENPVNKVIPHKNVVIKNN